MTALSSFSLFARTDAADHWLTYCQQHSTVHQDSSHTYQDAPADVVSYDSLTNDDGIELLRTHTRASGEKEQSRIHIDGDCLSCATLAEMTDYLPAIAERTERLLLILPLGVPISTAMKVANDCPHIELVTASLAVLDSDIEDDLWSSETLNARGVTGSCADERTPGEFVVADLSYADTALVATHPFDCESSNHRRTLELLRHIAPHLTVISVEHKEPAECGYHNIVAAQTRARPGHLHVTEDVLLGENGEFSTAVITTEKLIDSEQLAQVLPQIVEGMVRVRGHVWLDSHQDDRVAVEGIGPVVWLQTHGAWGRKLPATRIALTGEDVNAAELQKLLETCTITGDDIAQELLRADQTLKEG